MNISEGFIQSLDVIKNNKARSFLTMLGINFGVGCLIAVAVVGLAFRTSISSEMGQYGSTLVWIFPDRDSYVDGEKRTLMTGRDIKYFRQFLPGLTEGESIFDTTKNIRYRGETIHSSVHGVTSDHFSLFSIGIEKGRAFQPSDDETHPSWCILRPDIAYHLFQDEPALGKRIRIGNRTYTVIGVTERQEQGFLSDGSDNNSVYVPMYHTAREIWGGSFIKYWIYLVKFENLEQVDHAIERADQYLTTRYGLIRGEKRFRIERLDSYIKMVDKILNIISTLVLVIAAISILVGGLGIMNIMLVSVTERTREIGIRMAIGARRKDILIQFVIEAVTLCLLGGGSGVVFGAGLAALVCHFLHWQFFLSLAIVFSALTVSSVIGLVFGIYPAWKASELMPMEALRSDY